MNLSKRKNKTQTRIKNNAVLYGNKAANLIELDNLCKKISSKKIALKVPEIFPITDCEIQRHLDTHAKEWRQLWEKFINLQENKKDLTEESKTTLKTLRDVITDCFAKDPFSPAFLEKNNLPPDTLFMIRSSGDEDRVDISNPGGNKSVAAVKLDAIAMSHAIGTVVASYFSEKSLMQRLLSGDNIKQAFTPVLIQRMIGEKLNGFEHAKQNVVSGVMYAKQNGITRLDGAFGHGEIIVNSKAPFDTYEVTDDHVVHAAIHHKRSRLIPTELQDEKGNLTRKLIFKENPKKLQKISSISPEIAEEISAVGRQIAKHYSMPMDIEWVFESENQTLSIVQARPIPQGVKHKMTPSTIAPSQWKKLKRDPEVETSKTPVISPAGNELKIVNSESVILAGNIASALKTYLNKADKKNINAIIVKEPAPSTSHEAAQFNLLGVPVYQGAIELIGRWLKDAKSVIIADTQHQHVINMTKKVKEVKDAENELRDDKVIVDGMYTSSLSTQKTLLSTNIDNEIIKNNIKIYLANNQGIDKIYEYAKAKNIYSILIDAIETIEAAKVADANNEAFSALQLIADIFKVIATSTNSTEISSPHKKLFIHAMISIAEINHCLSDFSKLSDESKAQKTKQLEFLDLISKLKALVINPGEPNLYSESIHQLAIQTKALQEIKIGDMSNSQKSYLAEFIKFNTLALNKDTKDRWSNFSYYCAQTPHHQQMLSQIIMFALENNISSELINNLFTNNVRKQGSIISWETTLRDLYQLMDDCKREFEDHHINENLQIISSWENRINDWSDPKKFAKFLKEFDLELVPLISCINLDDKTSELTKQIMIKQIQRLAEVIDKSIKAMKGSMEYQGQESLLVKRFNALLTPYHNLMQQCMDFIPRAFYEKCAKKISKDSYYNTKLIMKSSIDAGFRSKRGVTNPKELNSSGYLSVASAKVGSTASFQRQFVENTTALTLEDYFSLFHQNILASTSILNKEAMISTQDLPQLLQPMLTEMLQARNIDLLQVTHNHPILELEFNIPLDNHSAKFMVEFNTKTNSLILHGKFFGRNWQNRMDIIAKLSEIEGLMLADVLQKPSYNEDSLSLEFSWQLQDQQIPYLTKHIKNIINHYTELTDYNHLVGYMSDLIINSRKIWKRHEDPINFAALTKNMVLEKRKELIEKISDIDKSLLILIFSKNPDFFDNLNNIPITTADIVDNVSLLNFEKLEKLIDKYGIKINLTDRMYVGNISGTGLELIINHMSNDDALKFLIKYQPDLTGHTNLFKHAISKSHEAKLLEYLFEHGAPYTFSDLKYAFEQDHIRPYAIKALERLDAKQVMNWVYENSYQLSLSFNRDFFLDILDHFKNSIDFTFKATPASKTLFEHLIEKNFFNDFGTTGFNVFLNIYHIDLSKQPNALSLLFFHQRSLGMFLLFKYISDHKLDASWLKEVRPGELAPLLNSWSADELKSWIDINSHKITTTVLNEITYLYYAKLIHALDPSTPEEIKLNIETVLSCFNNPKLQPQLLEIFKQWNSDSIGKWLLESRLFDNKGNPISSVLEFINAVKPNLNSKELKANPKNVNLDSLEDMLKYCFQDSVLEERIQHIVIKQLLDLETQVAFEDNDKPLSMEQKNCLFNFFKKLELDDWRIKIEDSYRFNVGSTSMGHGPRIDLFTSKEKITERIKKYITDMADKPIPSSTNSSGFSFFNPLNKIINYPDYTKNSLNYNMKI